MKKRLWSFIMAMVMVLTMVPVQAKATEAQASGPKLMISWTDWNNDVPSYNENNGTQDYLNIGKGIENDCYFVLVDGNSKKLLKASDLVSSDTDILEVYAHEKYPEVTIIDGKMCGQVTLSYNYTDSTGNSVVCSLPVDVILPGVGFYTQPILDEQYYIRDFSLTETDNTIYMISRDGNIVSVERDGGEPADITTEISADKSYVKVTVNDIPRQDYWYGLRVYMQNEYGGQYQNFATVNIHDNRPMLAYRWIDYEGDSAVENKNYRLEKSLTGTPGYMSGVFFYFVENGVETNLTFDQLRVENANVAKLVQQQENPLATDIEHLAFGNTKISYTNPSNGKVYSVDLSVDIPSTGFYSSTTASQSTFLTQFTVKPGQDTIYLVQNDQSVIKGIELRHGFADFATATISADGKYAEIKINGEFVDGSGYDVQVTIEDMHNNTYRNGASLRLFDGRPDLKARWAGIDQNGMPFESLDNWLQSGVEIWINQNEPMYFYFVNNGTEKKVSLSELSSSDEDVLRVTTYSGSDAIILEPQSVGTAQINYASDGVVYTFDVEVTLPALGTYKAPEATVGNYLPEMTITEDNNVFYVVPRRGEFIHQFDLMELEDIASVELAVDGSHAVITVDGTPYERNYKFRAELSNEYGAYYDSWGWIQLKNGKPYLALAWPDENEQEHGYLNTELWTSKGYGTDVWVYLVNGDNETKLSAFDLKSSNENVIQITDPQYDNGMVRLTTVGWGEAKVSYTYEGKEYSFDVISDISDFGYYSSKVADRDSWITEFTVSEGNDTYYFIARNGITFTDFMYDENLKEIATMTLDPTQTCLTIKIEKNPMEGDWYGFEFVAEGPEGDEWWGYHALQLFGWLTPKVNVGVGDIPIVDTSKPVTDTVVGVGGEDAASELTGNANDVLEAVQEAIDKNDEDILEALEEKVSQNIVWTVAEAIDNGSELVLNTSIEAVALEKDALAAVKPDVDKMNQFASEATLAQVLDLKVVVEAHVDGELAATGNMYELNDPIVFTAVLPEEIKAEINNAPAGGEVILYVLYVHNGKVYRIDDVTVNADGSISFPAYQFSTYALAYEHKAPVIETIPMHRLYNPNTGEHLYSGSIEERDMLVTAGWDYEGVAWNAPVSVGQPVYRVFNPNSGDHHYTMSQVEVDMLVGLGWIYENVAWNCAPVDHPESVPMYRLYNPNADCGSHHYTGSIEERDFLVSLGWHNEGIGWYGLLK